MNVRISIRFSAIITCEQSCDNLGHEFSHIESRILQEATSCLTTALEVFSVPEWNYLHDYGCAIKIAV